MVLSEFHQVRRGLWINRNIAAATVLTFALGIGPGIAIFGLFDRLFLRPLPFDRPHELVQLHLFINADPRLPQAFLPLAYGEALAARTDIFSGVAWVNGASVVRTPPSPGEAPLVFSGVTPNTLAVLGLRPVLGRSFDDSDLTSPRIRSVLLTAEAWRGRFGESPQVLDLSWNSGPLSYRVIGVLPPGFLLPSSRLLEEIDGIFPISVRKPVQRGALMTAPFARLQPGVTVERAAAVARDISLIPWEAGTPQKSQRTDTISVQPLQSGMALLVTDFLVLLFSAAGVVFLVTCLNLAVLLHTWSRAEEASVGLRLALGARAVDLLRLILVRSLLICGAGAVLAWLSYYFFAALLLRIVPPDLRGFGVEATDQRLIVATALATFFAAAAASVGPARAAVRIDLLTLLDRTRLWTRVRRWNVARLLLAGEAALSVLLTVSAGLVVPAFGKLLVQSGGFEAKDLYVVNVSHGWTDAVNSSHQSREARARSIVEIIRGVAGVEAVAAAEVNPLEGQPDAGIFWRAQGLAGNLWTVDHEFFSTLRIGFLAGRSFLKDEVADGEPVAILNAAAAKALWPGKPAGTLIGTTIQVGASVRTVVGISEPFRSHPGGPIPLALFLPIGTGDLRPAQTALPIVVRMLPGKSLTPGIVGSLLDRQLQPAGVNVQSVEASLEPWLARPRLLAVLFGLLSLLAVLLVAGASYALADFEMRRRLHELRIRAALGASHWHLQKLAIASSVPAVIVGALIGCLAGVWFSRWLVATGVEPPSSPFAYIASALLISGLAAGAALIPLRGVRTSSLTTNAPRAM